LKHFCVLLQNNKVADTSAADARNGKDIQGIPWERLSITRDKYRQTRLEQYKNYENIPHSGEDSKKVNSYFISVPRVLSVSKITSTVLYCPFLHVGLQNY
jgi:hypothetical protein